MSVAATAPPSRKLPFFAEVWALYGLSRQDAVRALFAAPATLQIISQLDEQLHLSSLLTQVLVLWRAFSRQVWADLLRLVEPWITISVSPREMDALTLSVLCASAIVGSAFLTKRESITELAVRSRSYSTSVQLLLIPLVALSTIGILVVFIGFSDTLLGMLGAAAHFSLELPKFMLLYAVGLGVLAFAGFLWIDPTGDETPDVRHPLLFFVPAKYQTYFATRIMLLMGMTMFLLLGFDLNPEGQSDQSAVEMVIALTCAFTVMAAMLFSWRAVPIAMVNAA
jgi:hypothetical protein